MPPVKSSNYLFILDAWLKSKVTSRCFQAGSIFWPTGQAGMASRAACAPPGSAASKTTLGHCRRWGDTGDQGIRGGKVVPEVSWGEIQGEHRLQGEGVGMRSGTQCSCWFWGGTRTRDRADTTSVSSVHRAQAEAARGCFKWRQRVFSTFPCQGPHCWSSNVFSTQPSQLVLGRDLISNIVWNSISPVRRALTMELPCAWWVMSTLIYCPWVLWKCLKTVTLPHCWALGLYTVTRQKVITRMGPFRGGKSIQKQQWAPSSIIRPV